MVVDVGVTCHDPLQLVRDHVGDFFLDGVHLLPGDPAHQQVHNPLHDNSTLGKIAMGTATFFS